MLKSAALIVALVVSGVAAMAWSSLTWAQSSEKVDSTVEPMQDADSQEQFAILELFTSEGCSSCPSADENLERIAAEAKSNGTNVYTLSYHVDYWNRLGWVDPYSDKAFTDRQRAYARSFDSERIYTPQLVVNGVVEFVGSNRETSDRAIDLALKQQASASISLAATADQNSVHVAWKSEGIGRDDVIQVVLVQNEGEQRVTRGENARRNLRHVNIVRQLETVSTPKPTGELEIAVPDDFSASEFHIVAFVQNRTGVVAAGRTTFK